MVNRQPGFRRVNREAEDIPEITSECLKLLRLHSFQYSLIFGQKINFNTNETSQMKIFHAGTKKDGNDILTSGGRVLCATALGDSVTEAQRSAYDLANCVRWDNLYIRTDIAYKAIARENTQDD